MEKSKSKIGIAFIFLYELIKLIFILIFSSVFFLFAGIFFSSLYIRDSIHKLWKNISGESK